MTGSEGGKTRGTWKKEMEERRREENCGNEKMDEEVEGGWDEKGVSKRDGEKEKERRVN